jgi:hypothetical protein
MEEEPMGGKSIVLYMPNTPAPSTPMTNLQKIQKINIIDKKKKKIIMPTGPIVDYSSL